MVSYPTDFRPDDRMIFRVMAQRNNMDERTVSSLNAADSRYAYVIRGLPGLERRMKLSGVAHSR